MNNKIPEGKMLSGIFLQQKALPGYQAGRAFRLTLRSGRYAAYNYILQQKRDESQHQKCMIIKQISIKFVNRHSRGGAL